MFVARPLRSDRSLKLAIRSALLSLALTGVACPVALAAPASLDATATRAYSIAPGPLGAML